MGKGKKFVMVLRIALVLIGILVATAVSYPYICSYAADTERRSLAERHDQRRIEQQAEREAMWVRMQKMEADWDVEFQAKLNATTPIPRTLLERNNIEDQMLEAATRLQPQITRRPRHAKRVVWAILEASEAYSINPFLALAFASRESSLRADVRAGAIGEQGLLQVHPRGHARRICGRGRDLSYARANADTALCYYDYLRSLCESEDHWVLVGAYGTGKCYEPDRARHLVCGQRKRAELAKAVGEEQANKIWPL